MARPINYNPISLLNVNSSGPKFKLNAMSYGKMLEHLVFHSPATYAELVEASGLEESTVRGYVQALRGLVGEIEQMVRICAWDRDSRNMPSIMVFEWAPGKRDVLRPKATMAQRAKRYRDNAAKRILLQGMNEFHKG